MNNNKQILTAQMNSFIPPTSPLHDFFLYHFLSYPWSLTCVKSIPHISIMCSCGHWMDVLSIKTSLLSCSSLTQPLSKSKDQKVWVQNKVLRYAEIIHACAQSFSRVRPFVTLWPIAQQVPLSMEFSRQEYWSGLPFHSPGDLLDSRIKPVSPMSPATPALAGRFF